MRVAQTKLIGKVTYTVNQLQGSAAFDLFIDLVKQAGPGFAGALSGVGETIANGEAPSLADLDLASIDFPNAIEAFCRNLDKKTCREIAKTLAAVTTVEGEGQLSALYELHFSNHGVMQLLKWLVFAVKVQFSDFTAASTATVDAQIAK